MRLWAGDCICRRVGRKTPSGAGGGGLPEEVVFQKKWELALEMHRSSPRLGLAGSGGVWRCRLRRGNGISRRTGSAGTALCGGHRAASGSLDQSRPRSTSAKQAGEASADAYHYGDQRPSTVQDVALQAKGWKKIRWREGSKGWLESRFLAARVQPSHGSSMATAAQGSLATGGVAGAREGADQILLCDLPRRLHPATFGAHRQMPLEDRAGLSPTQRRTGSGSLRRPQLERLAPSRHAGHGGARLPDSGNLAE